MIVLGISLSLAGVLIMLAEVQALKDQVAVSVAAEQKAQSTIVALKAQVADLNVQLTAAQANAVTAEDKAAVVQATTDLKASSDALSAA